MNDLQIYRQRRARLASTMQRGIAIVPTAPERRRSRDSHYPYRYDSYFYYLTGFPEPESVLVQTAGDNARSILFCRPKDAEREIWDGFRHGPGAAREAFGFDESRPIGELDKVVPELLAGQQVLYCRFGDDPVWTSRVFGWIESVRAQARSGISAPARFEDVNVLLDDMRLVKDEHEIAIMREAGRISSIAHQRAMRLARSGVSEFELEAELQHEFRRHGAEPAYQPIIASGANACVLHYVENRATLAEGQLVLIDAGCELEGYASDITRTFPASGRYSGPQKEIYEMVLSAQAAAIDRVRPGVEWNEPHEAAVRVLAQGMVNLGLCEGSVDGVIEKGDYKKFYMHRTGHWLGLDVHDVGDYKRDGAWRSLAAGMTLTVEPGCYVRPGEGVPPRFWNIGVRIEDDALVTAGGCEILTSAAPRRIADIEELMRHDR
jgi:Xaa-Pro aminopeptidase